MASLDDFGRTDLHYAALNDDVDLVNRLVAEGADVGLPDRAGMTPLHFAAQSRAERAAAALIAAGAPVDAADTHGNGALWTAVYNADEHAAVVELLVENGADPDRKNSHGRSPRDLAELAGRESLFT